VDRRGALLGPEESGRESLVTGFLGPVFLGHEALVVERSMRIGFGTGVGWLGPAFTGCRWRSCRGRGVFSLGRGGFAAGVW